jgi:FMN phosphatase YigB (HAD superfamily)
MYIANAPEQACRTGSKLRCSERREGGAVRRSTVGKNPTAPIHHIVFDLCGVLIHCDNERLYANLAAGSGGRRSADEIRHSYTQAGVTIGKTDPAAWLAAAAPEVPKLQRLAAFNAHLVPNRKLLRYVSDKFDLRRVGLISNLSSIHWDHMRSAAPLLEQMVPRLFSFQLGIAKPDRAMFEMVLFALEKAAQNVLVVDDRQDNIRTAENIGFATHLFGGLFGFTQFIEDNLDLFKPVLGVSLVGSAAR